jgi:general secretion pathway protein G
VTLIELVAAMAVLSILAAGILPLSQMAYRRSKEMELRQSLRTIRGAIDKYKELVDEGKLPNVAGESGYPKTLALLVEGVMLPGPVPTRVKLLRRVPPDPMTEDGQWGLRSYADEHDSTVWGGQDVYDVYSQSERLALDGTPYRNW